jgi:hypothetical protein
MIVGGRIGFGVGIGPSRSRAGRAGLLGVGCDGHGTGLTRRVSAAT